MSLLLDQVVETNSLMGYSLPRLVYSDANALFTGWDDHISCLDIFVWDPDVNDISRVSTQEDTTTHT